MTKVSVEGRIIRACCEFRPSISILVPSEGGDFEGDDGPELDEWTCEASQEVAKKFGAHLGDRVRITIEIIPTPKVVHGEED